MTVFLVRVEPPAGVGPTVAVKDLIDVAGFPTTCGSRPIAEAAEPAEVDAPCVATVRAAGGRIVGKTNLHELAFGGTGINDYTGTPTNPLDPRRIPGGSSSGNAVAVATGAADVAIGTDTGGSVRTPSACCGTVGLKTTYGRIPTAGVHPLAPSLDVVGPMAADVAGVVTGMSLLEPGFAPTPLPASTVGRFRLPGTNPDVESAIDAALARSELPVEPTDLPGWLDADRAGSTVAFAEALEVNGWILDQHPDQLGTETRDRLLRARDITAGELTRAREIGERWRAELDAALSQTPVIALAGILDEPPPLTDPLRLDTRRPHVAVNLAGHPAIVIPVRRPGHLPTSLQLIAAHHGEDLLVATAAAIEAAIAADGLDP